MYNPRKNNYWEDGADVGIVTLAGVVVLVLLLIAPFLAPLVVWLVFAGSYFGTILWVIKKLLAIQKGREIIRGWQTFKRKKGKQLASQIQFAFPCTGEVWSVY